MLFTALHHEGPVVLRYPRGSGEGIALDSSFNPLPIGMGEVLREGSDVLLVPVGNRVYPALKAAAQLAEEGISAAVINPRFIRPLDDLLITEWAARIGRVVTIEDNAVHGGFGSSVLQLLNDRHLYLPIKLLGYGDSFIEQGPQATLWANGGIDADGIVRGVRELLA
jgi:1-deoxy-D-xylulose-5-phosphate synthase